MYFLIDSDNYLRRKRVSRVAVLRHSYFLSPPAARGTAAAPVPGRAWRRTWVGTDEGNARGKGEVRGGWREKEGGSQNEWSEDAEYVVCLVHTCIFLRLFLFHKCTIVFFYVEMINETDLFITQKGA